MGPNGSEWARTRPKASKNSRKLRKTSRKLNFEKLRKLFDKHPMNKAVYDLQKAIDKKINRMMQKNPHRLNFYKKYMKIIEEYNEGKDAEAVKRAFEELLKFVNEMNVEEQRSMRENLDEETLAIFDLLKKENLSKKVIKTVKEVASKTLKKLKEEKLKIERWRESQQISAQVKIIIRDCLMHLPEQSYPDNEIELNTMKVYQHIFSSYFGGNKSIYQEYN